MDLIEEPLYWVFNKYVDSLGASLNFIAGKLDNVSWRLSETADELRWVATAVGATIP